MSDQEEPKVDLSLEHLQYALRLIDLLIQRQVRRWQQAGVDPRDRFQGLYVTEAQIGSLLKRPFGSHWGQMADLDPADEEAIKQAEDEIITQINEICQKADSQGDILRFLYLAAEFDLSAVEQEVLLICLASALDLRYEKLFGYLNDDVTRKLPTVGLALDLLDVTGTDRLLLMSCFTDDAPLIKYHLLERKEGRERADTSILGHALSVDPALVDWLLGSYTSNPALGSCSSILLPDTDHAEVDRLLAPKAWESLLPDLEKWPILVFHGEDRLSQDATARLYALQLERVLLCIDMELAVKSGLDPLNTLRLSFRDARLLGGIPYLFNLDACITDGSILPAPILDEICAYPYPAILSSQIAWQGGGIERERPLFWLEFPPPAYAQRCSLWSHFLSQAGVQLSASDLSGLAGQFTLTSMQIRDAVTAARDTAIQAGRTPDIEDLYMGARMRSVPRMSGLARKINPRYDWEDIVLPKDQRTILGEIVATVRNRPKVLEDWGLNKKLVSSSGVTILFTGQPGTGKTMAAEVIARELKLDLYKIELSTVVSKYIGETEKNLEAIFKEAQSSNAILFFDEADAIFGKRSEVKDAHDRYANIEISYLLQRMEAYDGVTILATNLKANLDEAFTRRLQFGIDFPFPEEDDRLRIWQTLFPPGVPRADDLDFSLLAKRFRLAGGNIRNVIVYATYLAAADDQPVAMRHLLHGVRRELQKMGRLINESDLLADAK